MHPRYLLLLLLFALLAAGWYIFDDAPAGGDMQVPVENDNSAALITAPEAPQEHFTVSDAAVLPPEEATAIYNELKAQMRADYAISSLPAARLYQGWQPVNLYPYRSETHGGRYVNNFANPRAIRAGYPAGSVMPAGAIIAKDSFTVKQDGGHFPGALFIMEKLANGSSPKTGDWRFVMILPDGSLYGDSQGDNAAATAFCAECHARRSDRDFLFGVPDAARRP